MNPQPTISCCELQLWGSTLKNCFRLLQFLYNLSICNQNLFFRVFSFFYTFNLGVFKECHQTVFFVNIHNLKKKNTDFLSFWLSYIGVWERCAWSPRPHLKLSDTAINNHVYYMHIKNTTVYTQLQSEKYKLQNQVSNTSDSVSPFSAFYTNSGKKNSTPLQY